MSMGLSAFGPPGTEHLWGTPEDDEMRAGEGSVRRYFDKEAWIAEQKGSPEDDFDPIPEQQQ